MFVKMRQSLQEVVSLLEECRMDSINKHAAQQQQQQQPPPLNRVGSGISPKGVLVRSRQSQEALSALTVVMHAVSTVIVYILRHSNHTPCPHQAALNEAAAGTAAPAAGADLGPARVHIPHVSTAVTRDYMSPRMGARRISNSSPGPSNRVDRPATSGLAASSRAAPAPALSPVNNTTSIHEHLSAAVQAQQTASASNLALPVGSVDPRASLTSSGDGSGASDSVSARSSVDSAFLKRSSNESAVAQR